MENTIVEKHEFYQITAPYLPEAALDYCCDLWRLYDFKLNLSKDRKTKLGDFRYSSTSNLFQVSVNKGLNQYAFLITYLHEVAHVCTYRRYKNKVKPHGPEWQQNFRQLAAPLLKEDIFPAEVLKAFVNYLQNPAASTSGYPPLTLALRNFDEQESPQQLLAHLETGTKFLFKERTFIKVGKKRTRALCRDLHNGRNYLISEVAQVQAVA